MNEPGFHRRLFLRALLTLAAPAGLVHGQGPTIVISPADSSVVTGQVVQFTQTGAVTPVASAGGGFHTCVLLSDRTVRCTGRNNWGQLGNGTLADSSTPVAAAGITAATSIGAGNEHTCALIADGTLSCWGTNYTGQLGRGTVDGYSLVPQPVIGISSAIAAAVGGFHTCALLSNGSVWCWGRNQDGQLGHGDSTTDSGVPLPVTDLGSVATLSTGGYHTCVVTGDARVQCWGRNTRGQLGDGTTTSRSLPVAVAGMVNVRAVSAGGYHTCALLTDGTVQCWGENDWGQLGNTFPYSAVPVAVSGITNAVALIAGGYHTCVMLSDRTVRCWGRNDYGELGDGTTAASPAPVTVAGLADPVIVAAGAWHTCALAPDGLAACWGRNDFGQIGNGQIQNSVTPAAMNGTGLVWTSSNTAVATIDPTGRAATVGAGNATISVSDRSGHSGSTSLTATAYATVTVTPVGAGTGTVASAPAGIDCGIDCTETYLRDTVVTLTAAPASGSIFAGWSAGGCGGAPSCEITMNANRTLTARFEPSHVPLTAVPEGPGTITADPPGIDCGSTCTASYPFGTLVKLTATPSMAAVHTGWTGCDSVQGQLCWVSLASARVVTATFVGTH
jgi:alpha-tubulin suppressor-like RCC1 family protein